MVKQLSNFFKKDSAGPVVIMAQGGTEAPAETPAEVPAPEAPAAETPAEVPTPEAETPAETPAPAAAAAPAAPAAQVSISAERLAALEGFERELNAMRPKYEVLEAWYNNVKGQGAGVGKDASEAAGSGAAKSWEKAPWNN
ncbi:hypothetical protein GVN20_24735 [Runella sp. CRIBMP]|uniref:hypothetical protein n=1 Tax=Runella sp. CRIBMP TaxID=2683261 RepID=UPI0014123174|nr:hypothetical protein [Runella sp. CRIBMP]NBB22584.1 hypothetical protein [Runella sp. CRIBMP]